jgi:hypothetical protein
MVVGVDSLVSYAAVCAHFAGLPPGESQPLDAAPILVRAQVTHKRQLSAKLVFIDLRFEADDDVTATAGEAGLANTTVIEAILKPRGDVLPLERAKELRHALHLGDRLRATVCGERLSAEKGASLVLHICDAAVEELWSEAHAGEPFQADNAWHVAPVLQAAETESGRDITAAVAALALAAPQAPVVASSSRGGTARVLTVPGLPAAAGAGAEFDLLAGAGTGTHAAAPPASEPSESSDSDADPGAGPEPGPQPDDAATAPLAPLCKFYINSGGCDRAKRGACGRRHPPPGSEELRQARAQWVAERRARKGAVAQQSGDPHAAADKSEKGRRSAMFADWLLATFSPGRLRLGGGVMDIAGGRGDVSFALANCGPAEARVPCTLVEPRPRKLSKQQRRQLAGAGGAEEDGVQQVRQRALACSAHCACRCDEGVSPVRTLRSVCRSS